MNQLQKALELAYEKHNGQFDKAGKPYFLHPVYVSQNECVKDHAKVVAILHDIIEDTDVTKEDLLNMGFDKKIVEAIVLITKDSNVDYFDYVRAIRDSNNYYAYWVKVSDLEHNMDLSRLGVVTPKDEERAKKYSKALDILFRNCE